MASLASNAYFNFLAFSPNNIAVGDYFLAFAGLLGGLGAFLIGVKLMSDSISKIANRGLRKMFDKLSNNKLAGIGIGLSTTAIIQSSAVTTVMVIGFVNAGIMSLTQATAVIMGANIGTTVTAQIAALQGFDFIAYAVILTVVGIFINMLAKRDRVKTIGMILAGLGIVFVSLNYMSISMKIFSGADSPIQAFFQQISNPFLLLAVGIIFTILMQSSSALTVVLIAMVNAGIVIGGGGNSALYIVLGSNIGTCFTALLSTVGTSANAKRAGVIHLLFNVFGSLLFMIVLLCWKDFNDVLFVNTFPGRPGTQIAMFHTAFNTICTILFVPFSSLLVKIATWLVKDKKAIAKKEVMFIDDRVLKTPTLAIELAIKEIRYLAEIAQSSMNKALEGFYTVDTNVAEDVTDQMAKIARINDEIIQYMVKISTHDISFHDEQTMSGLHHVLGDVVRIGDLSQNITKYTARISSDVIVFSPTVIPEIQHMQQLINELCVMSLDCFENRKKKMLKDIDAKEDEVDAEKRFLVADHIRRLNEGECQPSSSSVFINLIGNMERIADHLTYIAHSVEKKKMD